MPKPVKVACPFKLGVNVRSSVPIDRLEFKYSEGCETSCEMAHGGANLKKVADKMMQARHLPTVLSEPCSRCFGLGRHPRDISEACGECLGMGVLAGDSPSKEQLRIGPKFKLEVRPSPVKAMGLSVFAAEKIIRISINIPPPVFSSP